MTDAVTALQRLREGNQRFVNDKTADTESHSLRREALVDDQRPFAIILSCSDSRVPAELIFDQGIGDLFIVRVAGNISAPSQLASIEFAAEQFGSPLVVVMGHSNCGAIKATLGEARLPAEQRTANLRVLIDRIVPVIEPLLDTELATQPDALLEAAVRENVNSTVAALKLSPVLDRLTRDNGLIIIGAEYSLESGAVEFFDS